MAKSKHGTGAVRPGAAIAPESLPAVPVPLTEHEQWSVPHDDLPTVQEVVEGMGFQLLGSVDAPDPAPPVVPGPLFVKIQHWDREQAAAAARKQELMEMAIDLLGIDRAIYHATIDLDTGVVVLMPRGEQTA